MEFTIDGSPARPRRTPTAQAAVDFLDGLEFGHLVTCIGLIAAIGVNRHSIKPLKYVIPEYTVLHKTGRPHRLFGSKETIKAYRKKLGRGKHD